MKELCGHNRLKTHRGDTLIEVVVAIAVLSLLIALATVNSINIYRTTYVARERSIAYNIAQAQADALRAYERSLSWDHFAGDNTSCTTPEICKIIPDSNSYYDAATGMHNINRGRNPDDFQTIDDITNQLSGDPFNSSHSFYMDIKSSCGGSPTCGWQINPTRGYDRLTDKGNEAPSVNDATYFVTIIPNRFYMQGFTQDSRIPSPIINNDVLRFDIKVIWRSRISGGQKGASGGSNQVASLVVVLSRETGTTTNPGSGP